MSDDKMCYDVYLTDVDLKITNEIFFLKKATKYNVLDGSKIKEMNDDDFKSIFPFTSDEDKSNFKNPKNTEICTCLV